MTTIRRTLTALVLGLTGLVAAAGPAAAHTGHDASLGGWGDGLTHPVLGPDHLAAMVAVGILAAVAVRRLAVWTIPAAFLTGMVAGGAVGLGGWALGTVETIIAASVLALGVLIAAGSRLPLGAWMLPAVGVAGFAHGNAHGLEAPAAGNPVAYVAGFLLATAALHAAGALTGVALRRAELGRILGGTAVAAFGAALLVG